MYGFLRTANRNRTMSSAWCESSDVLVYWVKVGAVLSTIWLFVLSANVPVALVLIQFLLAPLNSVRGGLSCPSGSSVVVYGVHGQWAKAIAQVLLSMLDGVAYSRSMGPASVSSHTICWWLNCCLVMAKAGTALWVSWDRRTTLCATAAAVGVPIRVLMRPSVVTGSVGWAGTACTQTLLQSEHS
jgi:hypothetical protein